MALLTTAEAKVYLPPLSGTTEDTTIDAIVKRASSMIADRLGWFPATTGADASIESTTYTIRTYLGPLSARVYGRRLRLPVRPVTSVTSIHDDPDWTFATGDLVASTAYTVLGEDGEIILTPSGGHVWSVGEGSIKIVCVAGYVTIPEWARQACGELTHHLWDLRHVQGKRSLSQNGVSVGLRVETIPDAVDEILQPYKILGDP